MPEGYPQPPDSKRTVAEALTWLFDHKPGVNVTHIDFQCEHELIATDVRTGEESVMTTYPEGPWVAVDFTDGERYAIWKQTGAVYMLDAHGAVHEDPVLFDQEDQ